MTHPVHELKKLLKGKSASSSGRVISVSGQSVHVATPDGVLVLQRTGATAYKPGDTVVLRNGVLQGKRLDEANIPVFLV